MPQVTNITVLASCSVFVPCQVLLSSTDDALHNSIMAKVGPSWRQLFVNARFFWHFEASKWKIKKWWRMQMEMMWDMNRNSTNQSRLVATLMLLTKNTGQLIYINSFIPNCPSSSRLKKSQFFFCRFFANFRQTFAKTSAQTPWFNSLLRTSSHFLRIKKIHLPACKKLSRDKNS